MDFRSLPPPPYAVLLKDGKAYWAENFAESMIFDESGDFKLAKSSVGSISISTVFLTCNVLAHHGTEQVVPGQPAQGASFETMISSKSSDEVPEAILQRHPQFQKHASMEAAVLFHLSVRSDLQAALNTAAKWECKPYRVPAHGTPSVAVLALLRGVHK